MCPHKEDEKWYNILLFFTIACVLFPIVLFNVLVHRGQPE